jgi:hypothetical protein
MTTNRPLQSLSILGVHHVAVSQELFNEALRVLWGIDPYDDEEDCLSDEDLRPIRDAATRHFEGLRLIEIQIEPADASVDWGKFTQRVACQPRSNWQVAYAETCLDPSSGRWAFFMHYVDEAEPLITPVGEFKLLPTTPLPAHLSDLAYQVP